jgi:hypothetical protein
MTMDWPEGRYLRKYSPTRRAVVAGVASAPALLPAVVSAGEPPDARLTELGRQFQTIVQGLEDCEWSDDSMLDNLDAVEFQPWKSRVH